VPTFLSIVAPLGPAIPVMPMPKSDPASLRIDSDIFFATSFETAPFLKMSLGGTLSIFIFARLSYATIPKRKYLELPGFSVRVFESSPPVQDSAVAIVLRFFDRVLCMYLKRFLML